MNTQVPEQRLPVEGEERRVLPPDTLEEGLGAQLRDLVFVIFILAYVEDPAPGDENDPEYMDEVFQSFKYMNWKPEDLRDLKDQKKYADWLKKHSEEK